MGLVACTTAMEYSLGKARDKWAAVRMWAKEATTPMRALGMRSAKSAAAVIG